MTKRKRVLTIAPFRVEPYSRFLDPVPAIGGASRAPSMSAVYKRELRKLRRHIEALNRKCKEQENWKRERDRYCLENDALNNKVNALTKQFEDAHPIYTQTRAENEELKMRIEALRNAHEVRKAELLAEISALGGEDPKRHREKSLN